MTHIKTNGLIRFSFVIFSLLFLSCKTIDNKLNAFNYFNGDYFYNDSLKIGIDFWGALEFNYPIKIKKSLKNQNNLLKKYLLVACKSKVNNYNIYVFYNLVKNKEDNQEHEKKVLIDSINNISIYEKQKGIHKITVYVKSYDNNKNYSSILCQELMSKISFDNINRAKLSSISIFNNYSTIGRNYLQARKKLITAPNEIDDYDKKSNWQNTLNWQMFFTVNSFLANNSTYDTLINNYEKKRKIFYNSYIDTLIHNKNIVTNQNIINTISELAKTNQIIILNEDHYYPKHRIFAMQLLKVLNQNGYEYLSLEAFRVSEKNNFIPNIDNGVYTSEPYFAHFLRKAKELNFKILGHENEDEKIDREIGQAKNILKILEENPKAKIFIYVGHSHLEKENKKRWMASYLKEYSKINPITINQAKVCSDIKEDLILIPREYIDVKTRLSSSADYFLINNINASLKTVFPDKIFKNFILKNIKFKNKELYVEVFDNLEYKQLKTLSIPIINFLAFPKNRQIELNLPIGKYYIIIKTENNEVFSLEEIEVK
jgi:hypothetical protein